MTSAINICLKIEVRKRAKIKNRYNQAPHLTQDTNGSTFCSEKKSAEAWLFSVCVPRFSLIFSDRCNTEKVCMDSY